jgi:MFS transporter, FSR family, fosmidomycin resistance protein
MSTRPAGSAGTSTRSSTLSPFVVSLLAIEFLDELVYGTREAAWPLIRDSLQLSYTQVGLLLSLPSLSAQLIEPALGILADQGHRQAIVRAGGAAFAVALLLVGLSHGFWHLLAALLLAAPASGAFVSLSQASLMDVAPQRRDQNMARWALAGSLGALGGPALLAAGSALGLSWREIFPSLAALTLLLLGLRWRLPRPDAPSASKSTGSSALAAGLGEMLRALRQREVLRSLILLELGDLTLDVLHGFLALYFVDVAGSSQNQAALAIAVWTGAAVVGEALLIPLLERVPGLVYLRAGALGTLVLFPLFLRTPQLPAKVALLGLLSLSNAGRYSLLKARLYTALPGRSGMAMALGGLGSVLGGALPLVLGAIAGSFGLQTAMACLLAGPLALLAGLPAASPGKRPGERREHHPLASSRVPGAARTDPGEKGEEGRN